MQVYPMGQTTQRIRLGFNFNVNNIGGGYFSTQNYITYRHRYGVDQQTGFMMILKYMDWP